VTTRQAVIGAVAAFTAFFAYLTVSAAVEDGVTLLTLVSFGVLALFVIALLGMLSQPPDE
jgi:hypothetical protein